MKTIFPQPIGNLRELGTPRQWFGGAAAIALCAVVVVLAYLYF